MLDLLDYENELSEILSHQCCYVEIELGCGLAALLMEEMQGE
jgi:hypothetical protein